MELLQPVLLMLLLLNIDVREIVAQPEAQPANSDCAYVLGLFDKLEMEGKTDRFFEVLKNAESGGELCEINENENKIGPYQISKEYYDTATEFNQDLTSGEF